MNLWYFIAFIASRRRCVNKKRIASPKQICLHTSTFSVDVKSHGSQATAYDDTFMTTVTIVAHSMQFLNNSHIAVGDDAWLGHMGLCNGVWHCTAWFCLLLMYNVACLQWLWAEFRVRFAQCRASHDPPHLSIVTAACHKLCIVDYPISATLHLVHGEYDGQYNCIELIKTLNTEYTGVFCNCADV